MKNFDYPKIIIVDTQREEKEREREREREENEQLDELISENKTDKTGITVLSFNKFC